MTKTKELVFFPNWTAGRKGYAERIRQVFLEHLHKKELLQTPQRMAILNHLLEADRHLTQEEIYAAVKPRGIGKVTVFRALKMLEDCRLVERVTDVQGRAHYEVKMERPHHDHLICVECGTIAEIQWPSIEKVQENACKKIGFAIYFHRHEIFGRCRTCGAKQN